MNILEIFVALEAHHRVNSQASFDPTPSAVMNAMATKINTNLKNTIQGT
jgi:hypothetical protein